jgi:hypothetical protein
MRGDRHSDAGVPVAVPKSRSLQSGVTIARESTPYAARSLPGIIAGHQQLTEPHTGWLHPYGIHAEEDPCCAFCL